MKTIAGFFFLFFVVFQLTAFAQREKNVGVKVGLSDANQYFSPDPGFSTYQKIGLYLGVPVQVHFSEMIAVQLEPSFIQKGMYYSYFRTNLGRVTMNYLELPVFLKLIVGKKFKFNVVAGPSAAVAIGGSSTSPLGIKGLLNYKNDYDRYDFGVNAGAGIQFPIKNKFMTIDIRYGYGLSDIASKERKNTTITNRTILLTVGFNYSTKKE